ncbi:putative 2-succinyl-6-hydroxy-2,4-cyclohexadiene-1-carboxylate synthase [Heracleum sosnowskyi]|uniref:2-succinyl-6-hydroxy-2,4-cyclohexadiene-1-carboxylate synthase n=1 Tax=Heracleum sosnowskyi TaxID=360622 RepID=A0AAD8HBP0_9APIA|nr:putative 2-succinyl-6-hydroxy-2,4-cyclohexadiene-1-carboxylate synthase [Heracleum sosnowskyi]
MVNVVALQQPLLHFLMKMAGVKKHLVEIIPGTVMNFWVPSETLKISKHVENVPSCETNMNITKPNKPVIVLIHGFAAEGIVTWQFQIGSLTKHYSVYVPDLIFFGDSFSDSSERSPAFQAECLRNGLKILGVEKCTVVGFSYGGMVAFKMAEMYPDLVENMVVSGSILAMSDSISDATLQSLGFSSSSELLLPTSVDGLKALFSVASYTKFWFPHRVYKDYLEVMFNNRKERAELLQGLIVSNKNTTIVPIFEQKRIHLLWGDDDQIFKFELAKNMKEQLGQMATYQSIEKAGHLVHLERPCAYNKCLKQFLDSLQENQA